MLYQFTIGIWVVVIIMTMIIGYKRETSYEPVSADLIIWHGILAYIAKWFAGISMAVLIFG